LHTQQEKKSIKRYRGVIARRVAETPEICGVTSTGCDRKGKDLLGKALLSTFVGTEDSKKGRHWNKRVDFELCGAFPVTGRIRWADWVWRFGGYLRNLAGHML